MHYNIYRNIDEVFNMLSNKTIQHICSLAEITYNNFVFMPACEDMDLADEVFIKYPGLLFVLTDEQLDKPYDTAKCDFSTENISGFWDRIIINAKHCDEQEYIIKAYKMLSPGGILISTVSIGSLKHIDTFSKEFQKFLKSHNAYVEKCENVYIVKLLKV